jgi:iron complex outermembrane recepter protein
MSNINQLSSAIKFALFVGATASLATASAFAQGKEEAKEITAVEVTGSRIKRVDAETSQPIQTITREEIQKTGLNNVYDLLNSITASDGSGLSTVTTQTNGSDGSQNVSLRGLGAQRTLVLVDGKRWINANGIVDFTTIPVAIIERIDVLKDGASAIYGSDAIAGVINVITRKNYEGAQVGVSFGQYAKGDGAQKGIDVTIGANGERSNVVFGVNFTENEPIFAGDRDISKFTRVGCTDPATINQCGSFFSEFGVFFVPSTGLYRSWNPNTPIAGRPTDDPTQYVANSPAQRFNFAPANYLKQPSKISNVFVAGRFDITDNVSAYARASYTKRTSVQQLAPVPLTISNYGSNGPQWTFPITGNNVFNPFNEDINFAGYRMSGAGPRRTLEDHDAFGLQLGLEGTFSLGERSFSWDLMGQRNDLQQDTRGENFVNLFNLRNAVGQSGFDNAANEFFCGATYATRINGCVPVNLFQGPTFGLGRQIAGAPIGRVITAADVQRMINYITYIQVFTQGTTSTNYTGNLTGDLFELPGGMSSFAVGFETRRDTFFIQPDTLVASGGSSSNFTEPTNGSIDVTEYYAELAFPLLKDVFLAKELEFKAAVRKSDYTSEGKVGLNTVRPEIGSPTNTQFGIRWKPIDDLLVRASVGETFRAPSVGNLFGGGTESFPSAQDPCNNSSWASLATAGATITSPLSAQQQACVAFGVPFTNALTGGYNQSNGQIRSLFGGDPTLKPEFGDNTTIGLVYSPSWLEGFDISLDYWKIDLTDAIFTFGAQATLNRCLGIGTNVDLGACANITRNAAGVVTTVRGVSANASVQNTSGFDLGVGYRFTWDNIGDFRIKWETTRVANADFQSQAGALFSDATGTYNGSPNWEYRSVATIGWSKGDWGVNWTTRFMSELTEPCLAQAIGGCNQENPLPTVTGILRTNHIGAYAAHDINVGWKAPWDATVSVGGRNVFSKEPPLANLAFAHSFDGSYDLPGGAYWYAQYRQDF